MRPAVEVAIEAAGKLRAFLDLLATLLADPLPH